MRVTHAHRFEVTGRRRAREAVRAISPFVGRECRVLEIDCGTGEVLAALPAARRVGVDTSARAIAIARERHTGVELHVADVERDRLPEGPFDVALFSDAGRLVDAQRAFEAVRPLLSPEGRIVVLRWTLLARSLPGSTGAGDEPSGGQRSDVPFGSLEGMLHLAGYEVMDRGAGLLVAHAVARPVPERVPDPAPGVSVVCPCLDERGNVRDVIARTPPLGSRTELIFVDGGSTDGTVQEIERAMATYAGPLELRLLHQGSAAGKGDAVRKGFAAAAHEVLVILDSDLSVPPEELPKFYRALVTGKGDLVNGARLVYAMEESAMRPLNLLGNRLFSSALSSILGQPIADSLCGTKALRARNYARIAENRAFFGDLDPFGDFDLLFGAARLGMKIVDVPIRYRARTYGQTKIHRFADGLRLLRMAALGFRRLRAAR